LTKKDLKEIRSEILLKEKIVFEDALMKTNYSKKLFYLIDKLHSLFILNKEIENLDKLFIKILKKILFRGSNYFKLDQLYLLNNIMKNENLSFRLIDFLKD
jgi:hypothetical protein